MGLIHILPLWILLSSIYGLPNRDERLVGLFNYVTFPNAICQGTGDIVIIGNAGRSGVCWTKEECAALNGIADGGCASGYGVCCIFIPSCGATVKQNLTYLIQEPTTNPTTKDCAYTLCPVSESVNRIRLDFTRFTIASPQVATASTSTSGSAAGDCARDTFAVSAGGSFRSSPIICGTITGQHVVLDTDGVNCVTASFVFGLDAVERVYDIRVLQYETNNVMGGPPGCLQFFIGAATAPHGGTALSFNFAANGKNNHLSNQNYDICIRRAAGQCAICWSEVRPAGSAEGQPLTSFGLSVSDEADAANSVVGSDCKTDYVVIPFGEAKLANAANIQNMANYPIKIGNGGRFCGRVLNPASSKATSATVCSRVAPFKLTFVSDADEQTDANMMANDNETVEERTTQDNDGMTVSNFLGTSGFSLAFSQVACA